MKYLEVQELSSYNCLLDGLDVGNAIIYGKIEVYSCTKSIEENKLTKELEQRITNDKSRVKLERNQVKQAPSTRAVAINNKPSSTITPVLSPLSSPTIISPNSSAHMQQFLSRKSVSGSPQQAQSPFGSLTLSANRAVFVDLIATLNESYPDYDFSDAKPEDFSAQCLEHVFNSVNLGLRDALEPNQRVEMWNLVDSSISIADCDIFSYNPEEDEDPMALGEGKIWSWNYFFYNKKQKKLLFLACFAKSKVHDSMNEDYEENYLFSNPKNAEVHMRARAYDSDDGDMDFDDF